MNEDPLAPARGCLVGFLYGSIFWIAVAAVIWAVWFR